MRLSISIIIFIFIAGCTSCSMPDEESEDKSLKMLWKDEFYMAYGIYVPPTVVNDSLVLRTGDLYLTCFRIKDGSKKWKTKVSDEITLQTRVLLNYNGNVYGTHIEDVRAWDTESGEEVWRLELLDDRGFLAGSFSSINNDIIYIACKSDIKAINIFNKINYTANLKGRTISAIYYNRKLYCGSGWSEPDSTIDGPRQYGRIACLDATNGDSLWVFNTERGRFTKMEPIIEDGVVYCGTNEGPSDFYAINAETGQQIWKKEGLSGYHAIIVGDIIYVNNVGTVVALNKETGSELWRADINALNTRPMAYLNGFIYYTDAALYIVDAQTGEVVHKMYSEDKTSFWYVTAGADKLFLQSAAHLYCYEPWQAEN